MILPIRLNRSNFISSWSIQIFCALSFSLPFYCHSDFNLNMLPNHIFLQGTGSTSHGADHTKTEHGSCVW